MSARSNLVALVPIKARSERVRGKNFRPFLGRPLFHHILETLDRVEAVGEILLNTDSETIAREAPRLSDKVRIHARPPDLCGDRVSVCDLIANDLARCSADVFLQTHVTNPLLDAETIEAAVGKFYESRPRHDSLFAVTSHRARFYDDTGAALNHDPDRLLPTQELRPMLEENSLLYVFSRESFRAERRRIGRSPVMYATPPLQSIDIDDEDDFWLAETVARAAGRSESAAASG